MKSEFTAIYERDGDWWIAYCPEVPGANGQGLSKQECKENLAEAIKLILSDRLDDVLKSIPEDSIRETIAVS
jgi:predicted RNase H-like HicB family nuclease